MLYRGEGTAQLLKADKTARFTVQGLKAGQSVTWTSAKPKYLTIDPDTGEAQLKKTGTVTVTARPIRRDVPGFAKVNVNKGGICRPGGRATYRRVDRKSGPMCRRRGIVVVPKKGGQRACPAGW